MAFGTGFSPSLQNLTVHGNTGTITILARTSPTIWYQERILADPHEFGSTDRKFLASTDPDDQRMVDFMREIGFVERATRKPEKILLEYGPGLSASATPSLTDQIAIPFACHAGALAKGGVFGIR